MQNKVNLKAICIIYYTILMIIPIYKLFVCGNFLDIIYLIALIISTTKIVFDR